MELPASRAREAGSEEIRRPAPADAGRPAHPGPEAVVATPWSAVVIARSEAETLPSCLHALAACVGAFPLHVTLLLRGTAGAPDAAAFAAVRDVGLPCRIYAIPYADRSHALNCFLHELRPPAETYFFVDGDVSVRPDALTLLAEELVRRPRAHAAAAVPSGSRGADRMRQAMVAQPCLHRSLFALRGGFVERLAESGFRLPLGLCCSNALLGAFVMHDLDPRTHPAQSSRITIQPSASWSAPPRQFHLSAALCRQWRRAMHEAQGRVEAAAIRDISRARGFGALPGDVAALILSWIAQDPARRAPSFWGDPFGALALQAVRRWRAPAVASMRPTLLWESPR